MNKKSNDVLWVLAWVLLMLIAGGGIKYGKELTYRWFYEDKVEGTCSRLIEERLRGQNTDTK